MREQGDIPCNPRAGKKQAGRTGTGAKARAMTGKDLAMADHASDFRFFRTGRALALAAAVALTGCEEGAQNPFAFLKSDVAPGQAAESEDGATTKLVERDVEAPEVFQTTDKGLWDGRPSLGGVWVAHPDVKEPERVIIRNTENSKFVIGALFRRERSNPGPAIQVSSDAAAALGMLAGAPAELNVTALRREAQPAAGETPEDPETPTGDLTAPGAVETGAVETTALDPADTPDAPDADATAAEPAVPTPPVQPSSLDKPYIQIGIFSVEQNARDTATAMRQNGMIATVTKQSTQGKPFWRVTVGPAATKSERSALLRKIKGVGFEDAYPVTN